MNTTIDKENFKNAVMEIVGDAFQSFSEMPDTPCACSIQIKENLEDSGWRGEWTEKIRKAVRIHAGENACVCVKPLIFGNPETVQYRISVS